MLKKFTTLLCVGALSVAFVGCEQAGDATDAAGTAVDAAGEAVDSAAEAVDAAAEAVAEETSGE